MNQNKIIFRTISAIYADNCRIRAKIGPWWDYFVQLAAEPRGAPVLSELLNCERSGAHRLLEDLFTAIKDRGRGNLPRRAVEYWLAQSSRRLLNELLRLSLALPKELRKAGDRLRHAVDDAMTKEDGLTNFLLCESGAGRLMTPEAYEVRLDKFLRDLKERFNRVFIAMEDVEVERSRLTVRRARRRIGSGTAADESRRLLRNDLRMIITETRRRYEARLKKGLSTSLRRELELLARDEAWRLRCAQWRMETLYIYLVRA